MGPGKTDPVHTAESFQGDAVRAAYLGSPIGGDEDSEAFPHNQNGVELRPRKAFPDETDVEIITVQCGELSGGGHVSGHNARIRAVGCKS